MKTQGKSVNTVTHVGFVTVQGNALAVWWQEPTVTGKKRGKGAVTIQWQSTLPRRG